LTKQQPKVCRRALIHPYDTAASDAHREACGRARQRAVARARSRHVECAICLERVLDKELPQDRKFGLMTGCDHAFCLGCIREWRGQAAQAAQAAAAQQAAAAAAAGSGGGAGGGDGVNPLLEQPGPSPAEAARGLQASAGGGSGGGAAPPPQAAEAQGGIALLPADDEVAAAAAASLVLPPPPPTPDPSALRSCPLCRQPTHFVVPALTWPENDDEKQEVVAAYKARLANTDCTHFAKGTGRCPFGTSCFYRHSYADGTLERRDLPPDLKRAADADGALRVLAPVTLSSFFETAAARRALGGGGRRRGGGGGGG
jgi:hypothetical protein